MKKNAIGIDAKKAEILSKKLNYLLASLQVFYTNTRGLHWNIKGEKFFELHLKFEELYNDLQLKIDEVAERILTLGATPEYCFSEYLKMTAIKEIKKASNAREGVFSTVQTLSIIISMEREIMQLSAKANDEGTSALMSDYIRVQEKLVWMYNAYLDK